MRNSSDIFCLKEPKVGENDGTQIFSVNGSTSVKINRRHPTDHHVVPFGNTKDTLVENTIGEHSVVEADETPESNNKVEKKDKNLKKLSEFTSSPALKLSNMSRNVLTGDGVEENVQRNCKKNCKNMFSKIW